MVLALLVAAPAHAASLRGLTHRGLNVKITTDATGAATNALFRWRIKRCDSGRSSFGGATAVPSRSKPTDHFQTSNPYTVKQSGGVRSRVSVHTTAAKVSLWRWSGTFRAFVTVRRHGHVVDHCRFHRVRWAATTPKARLDLTSDQGDHILQGNSYSYRTPLQAIRVTGDRYEVDVYAGPWRLAISHRPLRRGHFRAPMVPAAGLDLSGDGRGCNSVTGSFTIKRVKIDKRGVKLFAASFVQHCEGGDPAARGTLTYRR